jgi:hypothetical protein
MYNGFGIDLSHCETVAWAWRQALLGHDAASGHVHRGVRRRVRDDGSVVYTIRVAAEEAPAVDAALARGRRVVLDQDGRPVETAEEAALADTLGGEPAAVRATADAFLLIVESFLAGRPAGEAGTCGNASAETPDGDACGNASAETPRAGAATAQGCRRCGSPRMAMPVETVPRNTKQRRRGRRGLWRCFRGNTPALLIGGLGLVGLSGGDGPPPSRGPTTEEGSQARASTALGMQCQSPGQLLISARDIDATQRRWLTSALLSR